MTEIILPNDANTLGNLLGGRLMHFIDLTGAMAAYRHTRTHVVTAAMDHIDFIQPVHVGDLLILKSSVNRAFNTSVEVGVKVWVEHPQTGSLLHVASAYLVFVAIDKQGNRQKVPALQPETPNRNAPLQRCPAPPRISRSGSRTPQTGQSCHRRTSQKRWLARWSILQYPWAIPTSRAASSASPRRPSKPFTFSASRTALSASPATPSGLPRCASKPRVAAFRDANIDAILDLKPDLVLTFSDVQAEITRSLVLRGATVLNFNQRTIAEIYDMIAVLARIVGKPAAGRDPDRKAASAAWTRSPSAAAKFPHRPRVYFEEWHDPLISGIGWVEELIEIAGGELAFPELRNCGKAHDRVVDPAAVIARNPDVILASWCGMQVETRRHSLPSRLECHLRRPQRSHLRGPLDHDPSTRPSVAHRRRALHPRDSHRRRWRRREN